MTEAKTLSAWLSKGEWIVLFNRLHEMLKTLYAWYRFGVEHGWVHLRLPGLQEHRPVRWNVGFEPTVYEVAEEAASIHGLVDIVLTNSPDFDDPFRGARRFRVKRIQGGAILGAWHATGVKYSFPVADLTAVRLVSEAEG